MISGLKFLKEVSYNGVDVIFIKIGKDFVNIIFIVDLVIFYILVMMIDILSVMLLMLIMYEKVFLDVDIIIFNGLLVVKFDVDVVLISV